jgi:hypothetical protein
VPDFHTYSGNEVGFAICDDDVFELKFFHNKSPIAKTANAELNIFTMFPFESVEKL